MPDRILTSHAGSLPRPEELIALNGQRAGGEFTDEAAYPDRLSAAVTGVVARPDHARRQAAPRRSLLVNAGN